MSNFTISTSCYKIILFYIGISIFQTYEYPINNAEVIKDNISREKEIVIVSRKELQDSSK